MFACLHWQVMPLSASSQISLLWPLRQGPKKWSTHGCDKGTLTAHASFIAKICPAKISKISYDTFLAKFHPPHAYDPHRKSQNPGGSMGFLAHLVANEQTLMRTSIQNWFGTCLE